MKTRIEKLNLETLGALERERERVSLYSTWNLSTRPHTHKYSK